MKESTVTGAASLQSSSSREIASAVETDSKPINDEVMQVRMFYVMIFETEFVLLGPKLFCFLIQLPINKSLILKFEIKFAPKFKKLKLTRKKASNLILTKKSHSEFQNQLNSSAWYNKELCLNP